MAIVNIDFIRMKWYSRIIIVTKGGPYDTEIETFKIMDEFTAANNLERVSLIHKEIYLSDVRRVDPAKLKTVLRYKVR